MGRPLRCCRKFEWHDCADARKRLRKCLPSQQHNPALAWLHCSHLQLSDMVDVSCWWAVKLIIFGVAAMLTPCQKWLQSACDKSAVLGHIFCSQHPTSSPCCVRRDNDNEGQCRTWKVRVLDKYNVPRVSLQARFRISKYLARADHTKQE